MSGVVQAFKIKVTGTQYRSRPGAMRRGYEETFVAGAGEALDLLISKSGLWDGIDSDSPFTIEIATIPDAEDVDAGIFYMNPDGTIVEA